MTFQKYVTNLSPMHNPFHYYEFSLNSFKINGQINGYKIRQYYVKSTDVEIKIPSIFKKILKKIMIKKNNGKQIVVFLEKI